MTNTVIVFLKNLTLGKVKTRLAATIGDQQALEVYRRLVTHTLKQVNMPEHDIFLYFSDSLHNDLPIIESRSSLRLQKGDDLGERMLNAFEEVFGSSAEKALIIGTDCPGLDSSIIDEAFRALDTHQVVIGPATDGGYYLLGMQKFQQCLFEDIPWSTSEVLELTLQKCVRNKLTYTLLKELSDIDDENDLNAWNELQKISQSRETYGRSALG
ncbi:TIGR04282 family arsenosugar biosynthesis glycosyltransferase [Dyadobacter bucti]|uniref:TIGR04282 family arsenosugar biosynthesis glycosyltransferase n=1 Tax=Dyadobacter bucti TaxID=2572203 RepID=UPI003F71B9FE